MPVDENATSYVEGNGRFDLMTDEEVRTLYGDDLQYILVMLAERSRRGELSSIGEERYHRLHELHTRYPDSNFQLEIIPEDQGE